MRRVILCGAGHVLIALHTQTHIDVLMLSPARQG